MRQTRRRRKRTKTSSRLSRGRVPTIDTASARRRLNEQHR
jgi:hypothetical protein